MLLFSKFFNSPVALKNNKKKLPQEKVEMTPLEAGTYSGTTWRICLGIQPLHEQLTTILDPYQPQIFLNNTMGSDLAEHENRHYHVFKIYV